jgi:hypothetical protein
MTSCRRSAELISSELDAELPLGQRVGLEIHLLVCPACRRYRRQLTTIENAVEELLAAPTSEGDAALSAASKDNLKAVLRGLLDHEA